MRLLLMTVVLVLAATGAVSGGQDQSADEVKQLKAEIEGLRKQLSSLAKENELLKREMELQKRETKAIPDRAGQPKSGGEPLAKASVTGVDYEIVKCVRKGAGVTFTFSAICEAGDRAIGGGEEFRKFSLLLTARGGEELTKGKTTGGPSRLIKLTKGVATKFQITYTNVDKDITEFDEVVIIENFKSPITFPNVKIEAN